MRIILCNNPGEGYTDSGSVVATETTGRSDLAEDYSIINKPEGI